MFINDVDDTDCAEHEAKAAVEEEDDDRADSAISRWGNMCTYECPVNDMSELETKRKPKKRQRKIISTYKPLYESL